MSLLILDRVISGSWERPVSLGIQRREVLLLLGRNGAGKTTLLNTIAGLIPVRSGRLTVCGRDLTAGDERTRIVSGVRIALEGRQVFRRLSVRKNLLLGAYPRHGREAEDDLTKIVDLFPILSTKLEEPAGSLSGGQQTLLSVSRALMGRPALLLLDEPTLGLDPQNTNKLVQALNRMRQEFGTAVLVAEQLGPFTRAFPERIGLLIGGEIVFDGSLDEAEQSGQLEQALL